MAKGLRTGSIDDGRVCPMWECAVVEAKRGLCCCMSHPRSDVDTVPKILVVEQLSRR